MMDETGETAPSLVDQHQNRTGASILKQEEAKADLEALQIAGGDSHRRLAGCHRNVKDERQVREAALSYRKEAPDRPSWAAADYQVRVAVVQIC